MTYIKFVLAGTTPSGKTKIWRVVATRTGATLGVIKFYGRWRQYAFFPEAQTIFNRDCMEEIGAWCDSETKRWRAARGKS